MTYAKKVLEILPLMKNREQIRNVGILAHIDHGKTTLSDNLLASCGLLSPSLAGQARALDFLEEEQNRGITIKSANISLPYKVEERVFIVNLIDTPGHVDFSSARDQSLRVIDGAIIVVDAVEGCMVQTEIVTKHALEEYVKPVLFINKIDRLITELKLSLKEIEKRLNNIIQEFNNYIEIYGPDKFKKTWRIKVEKNNIAFGSALHLWGCTAEEMLRQQIKFKDILKFYQNNQSKNDYRDIKKRLPLSKSIFNMIINHLPNPIQAQYYRIPNLWGGKISSKIGKALINCDPNLGSLVYIYKNISDKNLGIISFGRIFSGKLSIGQEVFSLSSATYNKIQQLYLFMGAHRESIKSLSAGNIIAFYLENPKIGDTLVEKEYEDTTPLIKIKYETEAVVQYSIEPLHPRELKNMINLLRSISINDPNLKLTTNTETGEILISGLGELHLDVIANELKKNGMEIITSEPIITFRESIQGQSDLITVIDSDPQNSITIQIEPLEPEIIEFLSKGKFNYKMSEKRRKQILQDINVNDVDLIQSLLYSDPFGNVIVLSENTSGLGIEDDLPVVLDHKLENIFRFGPLIRNPIRGLKIKILKLSLKSEITQFNFLNILPILKQAVSESFNSAKAVLLQPIYKILIKTIPSYIGVISSILAQRNGRTLQIDQKGSDVFITGHIPVKGTFGLSSILRSKTSGHIFWQTFLSHWEKITPESKMIEIIQEFRIKRGIK